MQTLHVELNDISGSLTRLASVRLKTGSMRNSNGEKKGELSNGVYLKLKEMICSGALKPSEALNLYELAKTFNTSVTPINSALSMLSEKVCNKTTQQSAIVASMSVEEVRRIWLTEHC